MSIKLLEVELTDKDEIVVHLRPRLLRGVPAEASQHARGAAKEALMAMRTLLDVAIKRMDVQEKPGVKGKTRIKVQ
ncbi:MAG: hypothetical protein HY330_06965 [Chloroflexi bacterium]|nr:hypothetical protein [Chloroflexota bacterium]